MALIRVVLKTAHYLADVWHAAGSVVHIAEEHFDPALHATAPPEGKPEGVTSIAPESIPDLIGGLYRRIEGIPDLISGLHRRIDALESAVHERLERLEQTAVSVIDFAKLHQRVLELETPPPVPPAQPPIGRVQVAVGATPFTEPPKEG